MNESALRRLLSRVAGGELDLEQALSELRTLPFTDLGYARVDHHRALRQGVPEVIFAPGKTAEQIVGIAESLQEKGHTVLATRIDEAQASIVCDALPGALYNSVARTVVIQGRVPTRDRQVAVVTAGTSDLAVAEEAVITLKCCGVGVVRINDVGVAGYDVLRVADGAQTLVATSTTPTAMGPDVSIARTGAGPVVALGSVIDCVIPVLRWRPRGSPRDGRRTGGRLRSAPGPPPPQR